MKLTLCFAVQHQFAVLDVSTPRCQATVHILKLRDVSQQLLFSRYLLDSVGCCYLNDDLCSLLVEIAAITTKTDSLALDLIPQ